MTTKYINKVLTNRTQNVGLQLNFKYMKQILTFVLISFSCQIIAFAQQNQDLKLWYDAPAANWNEALPIGNGRLGAMVFGIPDQENIQLNENTIWSGGPHRNDNPAAKDALGDIRQLLFSGDYQGAHKLANKKFISQTSHGMPYETAGNLRLTFPDHTNFSNFYRELDIENAIAKTTYTADGVNFQREIFSSFTDEVIVYRITANKEGQINFIAGLDRPKPSTFAVSTEGNSELVMKGTSNDRKGGRTAKNEPPIKGRVKFESRVRVALDGGSIFSTDSTLIISGANSATLYISIATNFVDYQDISANAHQRAIGYVDKAEKNSYEQLKNKHVDFYQNLFDRVQLDLGRTDSVNNPTDVRIKEFSIGNDPSLAALYFQYGRYLLISSSQPGGQPANLQGIWCNELTPSWKSAYTVNINTEMNYWPAEPTNLPEMHEPMIQMVKELSVTGQQTARDMYGAEGWVTHHNTDIWRIAGPVDGATWGMWPSGGFWLSQHLWEKYLYNGDIEYLRSVYPVLKGASQFCLSFLTPEPENGWLIMAPSTSPENRPQHFSKGVNIGYGVTMDNQLVFDILTKTAQAAKLLNMDDQIVNQIEETLVKLPPMQIGQHNQLQEWMYDWDSPEDKHRHVSHLYGLHPSNQISPYRNPKLTEAAKNVLIYRGDPSTGWSMNWKINLWARLLDGNHAHKLMGDQIKLVGRPDSPKGGGTYANMLDAHQPFQIDGNFGFTAGLSEMLVQSHDGAIQLLPALPDVWSQGSVSGLRTRGGFEIESLEWSKGELTKAVLKSKLGGNCRIRSYWELEELDNKKLKSAKGVNENPLFLLPEISEMVASDKANVKDFETPTIYEYDLKTNAGDKIILIRK